MSNIFRCINCGMCICTIKIIGNTIPPVLCVWGTEYPVDFKLCYSIPVKQYGKILHNKTQK